MKTLCLSVKNPRIERANGEGAQSERNYFSKKNICQIRVKLSSVGVIPAPRTKYPLKCHMENKREVAIQTLSAVASCIYTINVCKIPYKCILPLLSTEQNGRNARAIKRDFVVYIYLQPCATRLGHPSETLHRTVVGKKREKQRSIHSILIYNHPKTFILMVYVLQNQPIECDQK